MDKRERLLIAAAELFTTRGIQNTSTAAISRRAGVATGTLFNYFPSKDALIESLYGYASDSMVAATAVDDIDTTDYRAAFTLLWQRGISWGCDNPTLFWFVEEISRSAYRSRDELAIRWFDFHLIKAFIAEGISRGIVRDLPVDLVHTMVLSTISGIVAEILVNGADRTSYIQHSCGIVWRALQAGEGYTTD